MNTLNSLFDWIIASSLRASVLMLLVLVAQWAFKKRLPSRWRYALWLPMLVALLVPAVPLLPAWMNWPVLQQQSSLPVQPDTGPNHVLQKPRMKMVPPSGGQTETILSATSSDFGAPSATTAALPKADPGATSFNVRIWLIAAWLIGTVAVSIFVIMSFAITLHRIRRAQLGVDAELLQKIEHTSQSIGLRKAPHVLKSSAVVSPAVCGLWQPTLLLNEGFPSEFSDDETDMVLRHELTHIHRGDLVINALLCPLLAFHWFNPLLWIAFFRVRADREAACDAQVLRGTSATQRAAYGHTLLKMETQFPPTGLCLGFVGILQRSGTLRDRIHAIISQPQLNNPMKTAIALSILALTIAGIAKAADEKPETPKEEPNVPTDLKLDAKYAFKATHKVTSVNNGGFLELPLEEKAYHDTDGKEIFDVQFSDDGKKVTIGKEKGELERETDEERVYEIPKHPMATHAQLILKQTKEGTLATYHLFGSGVPVLVSYRGLLTEQKGDIPKPEKTSAKDLFDPIVKTFLEANPNYNKNKGFWNNAEFVKKDSEFRVAELEVEGLWETLGIQLFQLDCSPHDQTEVFMYGNGALRYEPLIDSRGIADAVMSKGSLYFTHESGSGIGQTSLVKVSRGKGNSLQSESLGSIKSRPVGYEDKQLVIKLKDVIAKLHPVKKGITHGPAPAPKPQKVNPEKIKDKVSVKFGAETISTLRHDGDRLLPRAPNEKGEADDVAVKITIEETTATPVPVQGDPTRSYLSMSNSSDKLLRFRALTRLKGSTEFYEMEESLEPVKPGELTTVYCWKSGTLIEEMILYQFTLSPEAAGLPSAKEGTSTNGLAAETTHIVDGTQAKRIETITKQLSKAGKLPGLLIDAEFVEEQIGDGILGPSDFFAFYALKVAPADLPAWRAALLESKEAKVEKNYAKPKKEQAWWVKKEDFGALEFFSPKPLTGRSNGWIGIAPDGRIFIYAFTM